ncbi:transcription factor bHLH91 [Beta vulgaris subsp. vulgaris]|uniref:transcription factor bHLH91 n=1 Tax=Beta vulgaris subsp. vulgaris TaxID=3555 RepID=UPI0020372072|nr:transcription factor bHLH91 [Beta vulgaris subsp. vulgaris]
MYDQTQIEAAPTANDTLTRNDPAIKNNHSQECNSSIEFQNPNYGNPPFSTHFPLLPNCSSTSTTQSGDSKTWVPTNMNQHLDHNNNHEMGFTHFDENLQPTTDFLTLLNIPRFSFQPTQQSLSPLSFLGEISPAMMMDYPSGCGSSNTFSHDPTNTPYESNSFRLNLPFQPSLLHPHGYGYDNTPGRGNGGNEHVGNGNSSALFGALEDGNHHYFHGNNGVFEFCKGDDKVSKSPKSSASEKQRRQNFTDKYTDLKNLIPNQTKTDRASIILDAITHIHELRRTVKELKLLVEKKRISKNRMKRHKSTTEDTHSGGSNCNDGAAVVKPDPDGDFDGLAANQLRSSWIQRKCKDTQVDVRIVDDDVTIKLVQRKKINCLLSVSRNLDELQLDLRHVAGGCVGDYYSYLFNSKICDGSSVYASAIANKLIEVVEKGYAAASVGVVAPTNSF